MPRSQSNQNVPQAGSSQSDLPKRGSKDPLAPADAKAISKAEGKKAAKQSPQPQQPKPIPQSFQDFPPLSGAASPPAPAPGIAGSSSVNIIFLEKHC